MLIEHSFTCGEVAEWSNAAVLKTVVPQGTVGSNPTLSSRILTFSLITLMLYISLNTKSIHVYLDTSANKVVTHHN